MIRIGHFYYTFETCDFCVWAPRVNSLEMKLEGENPRRLAMQRGQKGYWHARVEKVKPGTEYCYILPGGIERPDPASHFQPQGVHACSQTIDHSQYTWQDASWKGIPVADMILYELHVGTFTPAGTFAAVIGRLEELLQLGVNALEIMPVAAFPGERNWGYDGVYPYAVQTSYGGPGGLKRLVDACHQKGMAVILDVVYNHLGPEGNYLREFAPYFTDHYQTAWGEALNFDAAGSDEVRLFFIQNALHWFKNYHIDGLRLDAVHAITDMSANPFLAELADEVKTCAREMGRDLWLIAESDLNDARLIRPRELNGYGLHATWSDDYHHALHTLLTGEQDGYYQDFGLLPHLAKAMKNSYVYDWQYSAYRQRRHGNDCSDRPPGQFVVFIQNHDQTGNRMLGDRLARLVDFESLKLAAVALLLSPYVPLIFMGEEYGEDAPFQYFVSHSDPGLLEAVRRGRQEEFKSFGWRGDVPDPAAEETFQQSILRWEKRTRGQGGLLCNFYQRLLTLRKTLPALQNPDRSRINVSADQATGVLSVRRWLGPEQALIFYNFNRAEMVLPEGGREGSWNKVLDSADREWGGPGSEANLCLTANQNLRLAARSAVLYCFSKTGTHPMGGEK
ncbi:malto-oligosyltrehalose trehalohydrolase [candidate division FCPU426 bacterium]|nr:malto-oligosyltrehalose trehalohydrolase [candidate division FCPU426 bacterium]